ncbi:Uncharacterized protein AXF42_Ash016954 [Apostasia shenzhenica]|uniref:Late embryogenesis abundant protein LEA-2 subgroup domain-containing protein n=1 Tax=Apostasia shenzhenica TaxID=1088818 RepID=A0A2H9ZRL6_9ASPA|nr:Uncharacterized protein AXF42_Ash016954 [Apostasia shenzhenica]
MARQSAAVSVSGTAGLRTISPIRCLLITLLTLFIIVGIIILIFWLAVRPVPIAYSVEDARIHGYNLTTAGELNASFELSLLADNRNRHVSIYYDSFAVAVWYDDQMLAFAEPPPFHQRRRNETRLNVTATAAGMPLLGSVAEGMKHDRTAGVVAVEVRVRARIRFKVGAAKTKHYTLRAFCSPVVVRFSPQPPPAFQRTYCDVDV